MSKLKEDYTFGTAGTVRFWKKMNWLINEENLDFSLTNKVLAYINMYVTIRPVRE